MFTYSVTPTGPTGFQVSVTGPHPLGTNLIADFAAVADAEAFADRMREIDAGRTDIMPASLRPGALTGDHLIDDLIRRSRDLRAAAARACSEAMETEVKARDIRGQAALRHEYWRSWWEAYLRLSHSAHA